MSYFEKVQFLEGFKKRIKKEVPVEVIKFEFDGKGYLFGINVYNKSSVNHDILVSSLLLKHRRRIGNEVDELPLGLLSETRFLNFSYLEFYFDPSAFYMSMHYWDLHVQLDVVDKVYGNVSVTLPCNHFSKSVVEHVDANPWVMAVKDEDNILHPYKTVGGKKLAFLKRPKIEYDEVVYYQREKQAIQEYFANKNELDGQKAWLVFEKYSKTAQDNGLYFFKYAVARRDHVYYVIEKDSPDLKYLKGFEDHVVEFMSVSHMKLLLSCEMIIASEGRGHGYAWRRISGLFKKSLLEKRYVFLQHGVIGLKKLGNTFSKNNKNFSADKFICSSVSEKEIIKKNYGYAENEMILSGLPRWEDLKDVSVNHNEIFMMPTWRNWLEDMPEDEFLKTEYFERYHELISSNALNSFLKESNLIIRFLLHPKIAHYLTNFASVQSNIMIADAQCFSIRDLLQRSKILITDYSSVAWDFVYLKKPVVFYQFDQDEYKKYQGAYLDFSNDMPGIVAQNERDLVLSLRSLMNRIDENKQPEELYQTYFRGLQENPSEKIYSTIRSI